MTSSPRSLISVLFNSAFIAFLLCAPVALAQEAGDAPKTEITTMKVQVQRVVVDVTVTDTQGHPITGLKASDFVVTEDGQPQTMRNFEVHTAEPIEPLRLPNLPKNTFTNLSSSPKIGSTTVILYDLLNTPQESQAYAHEQLLSFLKERKTSGQIAIFVLTDKLHMLQGFTDDDNKLIAALNFQKAKGFQSGLLQQTASATLPESSNPETDPSVGLQQQQAGTTAVPASDFTFQTIQSMLKNMQGVEQTYQLDQRVDVTAKALQEIARFLVGLPGRKNLIWMSGSFPTGIIPDGSVNGRDAITGHGEMDNTRNYSSVIVKATDLLNLSHVAVYPVDVRGLKTSAIYSAGTAGGPQLGGGSHQQEFMTESAEHSTMDTIGDNTGGRAFYNTNGLKEATQKAIEEGSLYYTLTYAPTNKAYDGKLRKVKVELKQPGYHLAYRRTYFADNLDQLAQQQQDNPSDALAVSLEHGAPAAHELFFEAHVIPNGPPVQATPGQMAELVKYEAMATKSKKKLEKELAAPVMLQPYVIQYVLLPRQLELKVGTDSARRDNLELAAMTFNEDGLTLNGTREQVQDVIRPERWVMMLDGGYHIPMQFLAPVQARSMRLAVRDLGSGKIGSLEVPLPLSAEPDASLVPAGATQDKVPDGPGTSEGTKSVTSGPPAL
jgi:VWFA-related protein